MTCLFFPHIRNIVNIYIKHYSNKKEQVKLFHIFSLFQQQEERITLIINYSGINLPKMYNTCQNKCAVGLYMYMFTKIKTKMLQSYKTQNNKGENKHGNYVQDIQTRI